MTGLFELKMDRKKQYILNAMASIVAIAVSTGISFFLSPFIVKNIGVEANGYVSLGLQFVHYANLAAVALNSMASRFIMMALYNGDKAKAKKYYSSLFVGDVALSIILSGFAVFCIWKLESLINITPELLWDVKLLYATLFTNAILNIVFTAWSSSAYICDRLYLDYICNMVCTVLRAMLIFCLMLCLKPSVWFVGFSTLVSGLLGILFNAKYKRHLLPDFQMRVSDFSWAYVKELVSSGIWNTVASMGSMFITGLDLLVTNLYIGPVMMGVLAIAKAIPGIIDSLNESIANVLTPSFIIDYANNNVDNIVQTIRKASKLISVVCTIPLGFLIVYGKSFYMLWQPTQRAETLYILSLLTIMARILFTGMQPLFSVFTVVNKVKQHSVVMLINGLVSVILTMILVNSTNLGVYAVAGVSVCCCMVKNLVYVIPFSAYYLGLPKITFYFVLIPSVVCTLITVGVGIGLASLIPSNTWITLIMSATILSFVAVMLNICIVLNQKERMMLKTKILGYVKKNR